MHPATKAWGIATAAVVVPFVAIDTRCDRGPADGDTFTETVRRVFHTDTRTGRAALITVVMGGGAAALDHFLNPMEAR